MLRFLPFLKVSHSALRSLYLGFFESMSVSSLFTLGHLERWIHAQRTFPLYMTLTTSGMACAHCQSSPYLIHAVLAEDEDLGTAIALRPSRA